MSTKTVDARGELCPKPLIMTKKALVDMNQGETLIVLVDNSTARDNVERFLKDNGLSVQIKQKGKDYELQVAKTQEDFVTPEAEEYCFINVKTPENKHHVIAFSNNQMGQGPNELTSLLIQGFVNSIKEVTPLPRAMVFYTNGVFLTLQGSPVLASLIELEKQGVKILVCGTCLNYFNVKEKLAVGEVSNMYSILETLTSASHVVTP